MNPPVPADGHVVVPPLGRVGVWRTARTLDVDFARACEQAGFDTLWVGGSPADDLIQMQESLATTSRISVSTSIVNIWASDPDRLARSFHRIEALHPGRLILGIGSGHREMNQRRTKPLVHLRDYVETLRNAGVPREALLLGALGERTLAHAARRTRGVNPYLAPPIHTARARELVGDSFLAPTQMVVLDEDTKRARAIARDTLRPYLGLSNYVEMLRANGFGSADLEGDGSDRLVSTLVLQPDETVVRDGIRRHLLNGADHIALQPLGMTPLSELARMARAEWERLDSCVATQEIGDENEADPHSAD